MELLTHNEATLGALEIIANELFMDVNATLDAKRMLRGTEFSAEDGISSALIRAGALLQRAARVLATTEDLTNPEALKAFSQAQGILERLHPIFNSLNGEIKHDATVPS